MTSTQSTHVLVAGYFNRGNLGDDAFVYTLKKYIFDELHKEQVGDVDFINIDDLDSDQVKKYNMIFLGPGDVMNSYFIEKLKELNIQNGTPLYTLGVGFPYTSFIKSETLCHFDYVIHRNIIDKERLLEHIPEDRILYAPDITWFNKFGGECNDNSLIEAIPPFHSKNSKKIGVCLTRTMFDPENPKNYDSIVNVLGQFFAELVVQNKPKYKSKCFGWGSSQQPFKYEIYLVPFYCHPKGCLNKPLQDDRLICEDIYNAIHVNLENDEKELLELSVNMCKQPKCEHIKTLFSFFDIVIASRFHSHIFSAISGTPFVSIYTTRKVDLINQELGINEYGVTYKLQVNKSDFPECISLGELRNCFRNVLSYYPEIREKLLTFGNKTQPQLEKLKLIIKNIVYYTPLKIPSQNYLEQKALECANVLKNKYFARSELQNINQNTILYNSGTLGKYLINQDDLRENIAQSIIYTLLKERFTHYNYGLMEQVFNSDYNLFESCKWIMIHNAENNHPVFGKSQNLLENKTPIKHRNINISSSYNLASFHRSGWGFVTKHLKELVNYSSLNYRENEKTSKLLHLDTYLDKTFGWDAEFLENYGVLPLKNEWSGFFHHTPTPEYGLYTIDKTFQKDSFIASLEYCKHLFVLSKRLKDWIITELDNISKKHNISTKHIKVIVVKHPTEFVESHLKFNPNNFIKTTQKRKFVQIGAWLRDTFSIYKVKVPQNYKKIALKGNGMGHYYINEDKLKDIENVLLYLGNDEDGATSCQSTYESCRKISKDKTESLKSNESWKVNKYVQGLIRTIKEIHDEVEIIDRINNDEYDQLLSKSIVFLNLIDGSAINTLIECIVRNTPIIVNRIPAVEEYIGKDYPLFYESIDDIYEMLLNDQNICNAHSYLCNLNKDDLHIEKFMEGVVTHLH